MAGAEIGGDTSVEWEVKADQVRSTPTSKPRKEKRGRWRQHGIDETGFGAKFGFFITLKLPKRRDNRTTFITTLSQACADAQARINSPRAHVEFTLPIERKTPNQIRIKWKAQKPKRNSKRKRKR